MNRSRFFIVIMAVLSSSTLQAVTYANGWQPDAYSQLRMSTGYTVATYALMSVCFAYHLANVADSTRRKRQEEIYARAVRENRVLTAAELDDMQELGTALFEPRTWQGIGRSIAQGLRGKGGLSQVIASWALAFTVGERAQWAFKEKDGRAGMLSSIRRSSVYKAIAWSGLGLSAAYQWYRAAQTAVDNEKKRLEQQAQHEDREVTEDEHKTVGNAAQYAVKHPLRVVSSLFSNLARGVQGQGGALNVASTWAAFLVAFERSQWGARKRRGVS